MSAATALQLRKQRRAIADKMATVLDSNTPSAMVEWKALAGQADALGRQIESIESDILERADSMTRNHRNFERPNVGEIELSEQAETPHMAARSTSGYKREFDAWLRTGERGAELRDISVGSDSTLVPIGFEAELEKKLKYFGGLFNICRQLTTPTGNPLHYPTMDDTNNSGEWLAEAGGVGSADPTYSEVIFGANLLSSKQVKYSVALEQDSAFPLATMLSDAFGDRLGRTLDTALWTGDGSTIPVTGLLTASIAAGGRSVLAVGANANTGVVGDTDLNTIGTDDFSNLISKLDKAYQTPNNYFVFNQQTQNLLRKMKDKYGRPIWETSLAQGEPDKIFGYRYTVDNAFANVGAGAVSAAYGDPSKYVIRRALGFTLVLFRELYMANYQRAAQAFMRVDAKLLQPAAWSYLIHPQS